MALLLHQLGDALAPPQPAGGGVGQRARRPLPQAAAGVLAASLARAPPPALADVDARLLAAAFELRQGGRAADAERAEELYARLTAAAGPAAAAAATALLLDLSGVRGMAPGDSAATHAAPSVTAVSALLLPPEWDGQPASAGDGHPAPPQPLHHALRASVASGPPPPAAAADADSAVLRSLLYSGLEARHLAALPALQAGPQPAAVPSASPAVGGADLPASVASLLGASLPLPGEVEAPVALGAGVLDAPADGLAAPPLTTPLVAPQLQPDEWVTAPAVVRSAYTSPRERALAARQRRGAGTTSSVSNIHDQSTKLLLLADMARACVGVPSAHFHKRGAAVLVAGAAFAPPPAETSAPDAQLRAALLTAHAAAAAGAGSAFLACDALVAALEAAARMYDASAADATDHACSVHQAAARWLAALLRHYAREMMELLRRLQQQHQHHRPTPPAVGATSSVLGLAVALRPWAAALSYASALLEAAPSLPPAALVDRLYRAATAEAARQPLDAALVDQLGLGLPPTSAARIAAARGAAGVAAPAPPPPHVGLAFGLLRVTLAALMRGAYGALRAAPAAAAALDAAQLLPPALLCDGLASALAGAPAHPLRVSAPSLFAAIVASSDVDNNCTLPASDRLVLMRAIDAERHAASLRARLWRWVCAWLLRVAAASGRVGDDVLAAAAGCVAGGGEQPWQGSRLALSTCLRTALGCDAAGVGSHHSAEGAAALVLLWRVCGTSDTADGVGDDGPASDDSSRPGTAVYAAVTTSAASAASSSQSPSAPHRHRSPLARSPPHAARGNGRSSGSPLSPAGGRSLHRPHSWHGVGGGGASSVISGVTTISVAGGSLATASNAAVAGAPPFMLLDTSAAVAARRGRSARSAGVGPRVPLPLLPRRPGGARPASAAPSSAASTAGASEWESASIVGGGVAGSRALRRASSAASVTGGASVASGAGGVSAYSGSIIGGGSVADGGSPSGRSLFVSARDRRAAAAAEARAVRAVAQRREDEERAAREEARHAELARQAEDAARAVDDRRAARAVERAADATMVSAAAASAPVAPLRTAVRVTQPSGGATTFNTDFSTRTAVRVTQSAGGAVTLASLDGGDGDDSAAAKTSVRVTQPSGGVSSLGVAADAASTGSDAGTSLLLTTSVRVTQPSGGASSVPQLLQPAEATGNNHNTSLALSTASHSAAAATSAGGLSTDALDSHALRTHVRVTQPAGGASTVDALLSFEGGRGDIAAALPRRPSTAGGSSVLSAVTLGADTDAASTAGSDAASWSRLIAHSGVAISQPAGGVSTVQTLLYGSGGGGGESANTTAASARAAVGAQRSSRQAILNRLNASRAPLASTAGADDAAAAGAVVPPAGQPKPGADQAPALAEPPLPTGLPSGLRSALFCGDALDVAEARERDAAATPRRDADAAPPSTPPRTPSAVTTMVAASAGSPAADDTHTLWAPPRLTVPLPVTVQQALTLPLLRHVSLLSSAAVAAVLTVHDLPGHLAALAAWMLMGQGHVFASALDSWLPAATRAIALLGAVDGDASGAAAAAAPTGHAHDVPPLLSRAHAAAYANACVGWALAEHGLKGAVDTYEGEVARRARLALHAARSSGSSGGDGANASPLLRDSDLAPGELAALLRLEARANVVLPPALSHARRFRYVAAPAAVAAPAPSPAAVSASGAVAFVTDVLAPVYSLGDDAVDGARTSGISASLLAAAAAAAAHSPPPLLLARVLTPRVLARFGALHAHLLRLRHVSWALRRTWSDLAAVGRGAAAAGGASARRRRRGATAPAVALPAAVTLFRHEAGVFLGALESHAGTQLHGHALPGLARTLATNPSCATLDGLSSAVDDASVDMLRRCLVPEPAAAAAAPAASAAQAALSRGAAVLQAALADVLAACAAIREALADAEAATAAVRAAEHDGDDGRMAAPQPLPPAVVARVTVHAADFRRRAGLLRAGLAALAAAAVGDPRYAFAGELLEALRAAAGSSADER